MTPARYHPLVAGLHWALAPLILGMLAVGFFVLAPEVAREPGKLGVLKLHMATGSLILALMLVRVIVRWRTRAPASGRAASLSHLALYLLVFGMIATGFAMAVLTGLNLVVFGAPGQPMPAGLEAHPARVGHRWLAWLLTALVAGHLAAALVHQFVRRNGVMRRMTVGRR